MSDTRIRELERRWRETGSDDDEAGYLLARARAGDDFSRELLETAAFAGSTVALSTLGRAPARAAGFTARASTAIDHALHELRTTGDARFDLHLLAGSIAAPDSIACSVLADLGLTPSEIASAVRQALASESKGTSHLPRVQPTLLPVLAHEERGRQATPPTGTQHLLLALLMHGRGEAADLLASKGLVYWDTRQAAIDLLAAGAREP